MFERIIISNILSRNFSFDDYDDIHKSSALNLKRINSHKNIRMRSNVNNKKFNCENIFEINSNDKLNNNNRREAFSASKLNDYESLKFAKTSKCNTNTLLYEHEQKNHHQLLYETKTNTNELLNKTHDQDTKANKVVKSNKTFSNSNLDLRNSYCIDDDSQKNKNENFYDINNNEKNNTDNYYNMTSSNPQEVDANRNFIYKNFTQSREELMKKSNNNIYSINNEKGVENGKTTSRITNNEKNLLKSGGSKKNKKISLIENHNNTTIKNKSINNNDSLIENKIGKLNYSNKNLNEKNYFDVTPFANLDLKLNSSFSNSLINNFKNLNSLLVLTQQSKLPTTENYSSSNKFSIITTNADKNSNQNVNKTPKKNEMKIISSNNNNNKNLLSNNKSKNNSLKSNNHNNIINSNEKFNILLNKSNKRSLQDISEKKDYLHYKKSSEAFLNNSKLSNEKEKNINNYKKNKAFPNKNKTSNNNTSIGNNEENYNSIINEHHFPENNESEYLTYNKSVSSEINKKSFTNRQSAAVYSKKKLNDSPFHEKIKKSNSKRKMNVIRLPKKPLNNKHKNLKIIINPIYEFQNKNHFCAVNRINENVNKLPPTTADSINQLIENPQRNKKQEEEIVKIEKITNNPYITTTSQKNIKLNLHLNSDNLITGYNPNDDNTKPSLAVYDFSNEENLFGFVKKNISHTPCNRVASAGLNCDSNFKDEIIQPNNIIYSNKNKTSAFNFKRFNYVFGDGNSTTNKTKTSFLKSQTDLISTKTTDQNTTNTINSSSYNFNNTNYSNNDKINQKVLVSNQQNAISSKEFISLIKKVQFDGDITNLKGRIKKN